jgi:hypothetical protein
VIRGSPFGVGDKYIHVLFSSAVIGRKNRSHLTRWQLSHFGFSP